MNVFIELFVGRLPEHLRNTLVKTAMSALASYLIVCDYCIFKEHSPLGEWEVCK